MRTRVALHALASAEERRRAAEETHRDAIRAASDAGASLRQIAAHAGLSHEQVRRIVRERPSVSPYFVTVERRGVPHLTEQLLVRAASGQAAGEFASWIAESRSGGVFEATKVHRAAGDASACVAGAFDDADL